MDVLDLLTREHHHIHRVLLELAFPVARGSGRSPWDTSSRRALHR